MNTTNYNPSETNMLKCLQLSRRLPPTFIEQNELPTTKTTNLIHAFTKLFHVHAVFLTVNSQSKSMQFEQLCPAPFLCWSKNANRSVSIHIMSLTAAISKFEYPCCHQTLIYKRLKTKRFFFCCFLFCDYKTLWIDYVCRRDVED